MPRPFSINSHGEINMPSTIVTRAQDIKRNKAFIYAAADGENDKIRQLLEAKISVDVQDSRGKTALMWAAENEQADTVSLLLEAKASIDMQDGNGDTALIHTVCFKKIDSVRQLLDAKASVEIENNKKMTALDKTTEWILAGGDNYIPIINMLLAPNVNATVRDHSALYDFLTLFHLEQDTLPALMALYKQVCTFINHHPNPLSDEKFDSLQRIYNYGMLTEKNVPGLTKPFFHQEEHTHKDTCCSHLQKAESAAKKMKLG